MRSSVNALNILSRASVLSEEEKRRRTPIMLFTTACTCFACVSQLRLSVSVTPRILIAFDCMMLALPGRNNSEKSCLHLAILEYIIIEKHLAVLMESFFSNNHEHRIFRSFCMLFEVLIAL